MKKDSIVTILLVFNYSYGIIYNLDKKTGCNL